MTDAMIRLRRVTKTFPGATNPAVNELTIDIAEGEIAVLIGPSGCGKTTTLKMINRLIEPTAGAIDVAGQDVTTLEPHQLRRGIGYVIQQVGLFPHKTVAANIAVVPRLLGWDHTRISQRVDELVDLMELEPGMQERYPAELSGGQRQRVGVARALAADPPVLLMDEPFGAVDPIVRSRLQEELLRLQAQLRKTIVFVTHDIDEAVKLGDRVALLNVGGILEQYASPAAVLRDPANDFVADFLGTDRGLKRLSLLPISGVDLLPGPVVPPGSTAEEARTVMAEHGLDWFMVGEDGQISGWLSAEDLSGGRSPAELQMRPVRTILSPDSSLRDGLDAVVSSRTRAATVFDGDTYMGILTIDQIGDEVLR
jgi:osmoprotectant transport system ATP-binding protein